MVYFLIQYIHIKRIFKTVSRFFLLLCSIWEISNYLSPRVIVQSHLKGCLISKDLQIIRKKADTILIRFIRVAPLKILKRCCNAFGTCNSPSTIGYNHLKKQQGNYFTSLVALNMLWCVITWFFTCLIFDDDDDDDELFFSLISSRDHCQRSSPSRISDTGFGLAQNLSSGLVEWSCAVVITTTPRRHLLFKWIIRSSHLQLCKKKEVAF